jgi:hypothetical protein
MVRSGGKNAYTIPTATGQNPTWTAGTEFLLARATGDFNGRFSQIAKPVIYLSRQADEERTRTRFRADLHEVFEPRIAAHQGRPAKTMGDGIRRRL